MGSLHRIQTINAVMQRWKEAHYMFPWQQRVAIEHMCNEVYTDAYIQGVKDGDVKKNEGGGERIQAEEGV